MQHRLVSIFGKQLVSSAKPRHMFQVLAVHERGHGTKTADRFNGDGRTGRVQLAYDLVYLDDHNRESEVRFEAFRVL